MQLCKTNCPRLHSTVFKYKCAFTKDGREDFLQENAVRVSEYNFGLVHMPRNTAKVSEYIYFHVPNGNSTLLLEVYPRVWDWKRTVTFILCGVKKCPHGKRYYKKVEESAVEESAVEESAMEESAMEESTMEESAIEESN